jgi:hypothetical protein
VRPLESLPWPKIDSLRIKVKIGFSANPDGGEESMFWKQTYDERKRIDTGK